MKALILFLALAVVGIWIKLLSPQARREVWEALKLTFVPLVITLLTVAVFLLLSNFPIQVF